MGFGLKFDSEIEELTDLETVSHLYGLSKIAQNERERNQLENVYEQVQRYDESERPGSRLDRVEEGLDLWTEICCYWIETGKYEADGLAAVTPVLAVYGDLDVNVEGTDNMDELKEILDKGINYFE